MRGSGKLKASMLSLPSIPLIDLQAGKEFMNIALPLPFSTMTGVLELNAIGNDLQLTSKKTSTVSDAGIYLTSKFGTYFRLPIEENFVVREETDGSLSAKHEMWIFSVPFLTIDYRIQQK